MADDITDAQVAGETPVPYRGRFSDDGDTNAGASVYPGGGGYDSTMTRVR